MRLQELLRPEDLLLNFEALDKWQAIDKLMAHLVGGGRVPADLAEGVHEAVLARERSMSTGMERGIAMPHAAVDGLEEIAACLAVTAPGTRLNFEGVDAAPTRYVMLLAIPRSQKLLHIRTLAEVARVLGKESVRDALASAKNHDEAWAALAPEP